MDKYITKKMPEIFGERSITMNPFIMGRLGINRNRCLIKLDDIKLACVPYRISDRGCKVLLFLSRREQEFLNSEEFDSITFHMEVWSPEYEKCVPLFFRVNIELFQELNQKHNQCLITLSYQSVPKDYNDLIDNFHALEKQISHSYYSPVHTSQLFPYTGLRDLNISKNAALTIDQGERISGRIMNFSLNRIILYVDADTNPFYDDREYQLELTMDECQLPIGANLIDSSRSAEIPGLYIAKLGLERNSFYIERILPLLKDLPAPATLP